MAVPSGVEAAIAAIEECAATRSSELDLQQLSISDDDLFAILKHPKLQEIAGRITTLNLFLNEITKLPAQIGLFSALRVLHAGANPLSSISDDLLRSLPCLEELDIGFSELLAELPNTFDATPALRILRCGNNRVRHIPSTLYSCANLQELHLYGNCLSSLASDIANLKSLTTLNVGRNQLDSLPPQLAECKDLKCIRAYENFITSLPPGLTDLPALTELNVVANQLSQ